MTKIIAAINMTIDGFCDHTAISPDEQIHHHYADLLAGADAILYGRITYQPMQYWQQFLENPSGEKSMDDFAEAIDKIPKIVFSKTLETTGWESAKLATQSLEATVKALKQQTGGNVFIGSRSLINALTNHYLIDEYQLCIHPVVLGKGKPLFDSINGRTVLNLTDTKIFDSGAAILYYNQAKPENLDMD